MLTCSFIHGNEDLFHQVFEDYVCESVRNFRELEKANRVCMFNNKAYLLNESGQWVSAAYEVPSNLGEWLEDLAQRGVCPKEHRGVYLDQTIYECGLWYCRGVMRNEERCPYHVDIQFPNGIPKTN